MEKIQETVVFLYENMRTWLFACASITDRGYMSID